MSKRSRKLIKHFIDIERNITSRETHRVHFDALRGGETQKELEKRLDEQYRNYPDVGDIERLRDEHIDYFLDTSTFDGRNQVLRNLLIVIPYLNVPGYRDVFDKQFDMLESYCQQMTRFLSRQNVYVIKEVLDEINKYKKIFDRRLDQLGMKNKSSVRVIKPVKAVLDCAREANSRLDDLEDDPMVERIKNLIPENNKLGAVSLTDRYLIAKALSIGINDRRNKLLVTSDKGIWLALRRLFYRLYDNPQSLNVDDLNWNNWNFPKVQIGIYNTDIYFNDFFHPCYLYRKDQLNGPI